MSLHFDKGSSHMAIELYNYRVQGDDHLIHTNTNSYNNMCVEPPIKDTIEKPLYKGHTLRSQSSTFLLYKYIFNLRREDNLSIKDKMPGPNVSIIRRFHCIYVGNV